jgi:hypothetical protein
MFPSSVTASIGEQFSAGSSDLQCGDWWAQWYHDPDIFSLGSSAFRVAGDMTGTEGEVENRREGRPSPKQTRLGWGTLTIFAWASRPGAKKTFSFLLKKRK